MGREENMAETQGTRATPGPSMRIPFMQRILDNPFLLLFLGVVIPTVIYILWGVVEIANIRMIDLVK
jgi:hypothetical protein